MTRPVSDLYPILGYHFQNAALLTQALTHRSVSTNNNERLEFLGDAILNYIIANVLYEHCPKAKEGDLTRLRAALVNGETLALVAQGFQVGEYLLLGVGELKSGGHRRASILADAVEAMIAAIYLDSDIVTATRVVSQWFVPYVDNLQHPDLLKDSKTRLQEYLQAQRLPLPDYQVIETTGEPHCQTFTVACRVQGVAEPVIGVANNRRRAEQEAARILLQKLNENA